MTLARDGGLGEGDARDVLGDAVDRDESFGAMPGESLPLPLPPMSSPRPIIPGMP